MSGTTDNVLKRSFLQDLLVNFQAYNKLWIAILTFAVAFSVRQGWIAPNSIDERMISDIIGLIGLIFVGVVPNRKELSSGERVNVNEIDVVVDKKVEQAVTRVENQNK